jgi:predicted ATPase
MEVKMDKSWVLHIENFAKIKSAEIEISPFMCFVGDNHSGKSYLMSLIWGILTLGKDLFPKNVSESRSYKACESWLIGHSNQEVIITEDVSKLYVNWFNELLSNHKKMLLKKLFNFDIDADKIEILNYKSKNHMMIKWENQSSKYAVTKTYINFSTQENYTKEDISKMNAYICWNLLMSGLASPLYTSIVRGKRTGEPIYLPASRTGFMLTYSQLLEKSIETNFSSSEDTDHYSMLTLPYVDFLRLMIKFEPSDKVTHKDIIDFIEGEMTKVSSSFVSEVSPILLTLKSNINFNTLMIEEPETHLHPKLQQKIAQVIIRLMNSGVSVWITTHSEIIIQHMNNMIKLKRNKKSKELCKEYSYTREDLVDANDVRMYQFSKIEKEITMIEKLSHNENGFIVPTFNQVLQSIVEEVYAFQGE